MNIYLKYLFSILLLLVSVRCSSYQADNTLKPNESLSQEQIDIIVKYSGTFPDGTELAFGFIEQGKINYFGVLKNTTDFTSIVNQDKVFEIGSITKVFTSTILSNLILENKILLNDPIINDLDFSMKESEKKGKQITYLTLSNHTSGLPRLPSNIYEVFNKNPSNPYVDYTMNMWKDYFKNEMKLESVPGEKYQYSNMAVGLLGHLMEEMSGMDYEQLLRKYILDSLKMDRSSSMRDNLTTYLVPGLDPNGNVTSNWDLGVMEAAGSICSSVEDLTKFMFWNFEKNEIVQLQMQTTFEINADLSVALGWHISTNKSNPWFWHNGGTGGYRSIMILEPENKNGVIILSNVSAFHDDSGNIDRMGSDLMAFIVKQP